MLAPISPNFNEEAKNVCSRSQRKFRTKKQKIDTEKYKRHCFGRKMANSVGYCYDGKFERNILIVGQMGCGKTTFVQNLEKNGMFGNI